MILNSTTSSIRFYFSSLVAHSVGIRAARHEWSSLFARRLSTLPRSQLFETLLNHDPASSAVIHSRSQRSFTYANLVQDVARTRQRLNLEVGRKIAAGERVAFLAENSYDYVVTFLSIIANDAVALPLAGSFPEEEIRYILQNSDTSLLIATERFQDKAQSILRTDDWKIPELLVLPKICSGGISTEKIQLDDGSVERGGIMLYTSGTTNRPKGVVLSTSVMMAQAQSLIEAWQYSQSDVLLHVLPLHHIHGVINALFTPLMAGSAIEFAYPFNADAIWRRFAAPFVRGTGASTVKPITFFTVVPYIYSKLISTFAQLPELTKSTTSKAVSREHLRLNISGSAALPTPVKDAWTELSNGNVLLERYGMTEVGMALSCGLDLSDRVDGSVGWPLPSVEIRLVDSETGEVIEASKEVCAQDYQQEGEIQLRGPTIFSEYWNNPQATAEDFEDDVDGKGKWFKTGDIAVRRTVSMAGKSDQAWARGPMYFIKGRRSVDIIKIGGEKVSALEVERELLSLPQIAEAAVLGIDSEQWGEKVAAVITLTAEGKHCGKAGGQWNAMDMRRALKDRLARHKIPQELRIVDSIPRNAMGKINKKLLAKRIFPHSQ